MHVGQAVNFGDSRHRADLVDQATQHDDVVRFKEVVSLDEQHAVDVVGPELPEDLFEQREFGVVRTKRQARIIVELQSR